jgi:D-alanine-D-alanine ligase-like ATP-grasp enzyme
MTNKIRLTSNSAQVVLDSLRKRGIKVRVISKRFNLLEVVFNGKSTFIKGTSFPVNPQPACFIANNKYLTKRILQKHGITTPKSWLLKTPKEVKRKVLKNNLFPCVLKPIKGAHGNRVFANVESLDELEEVLPLVFGKFTKRNILLEEFIDGKDYRLMVIGDKVSAVMERIPAHVTGDGKSNIGQLIEKFNKNPLIGEKYEKPLCKIVVNGEVKRNLKKQNKKLTYIPKAKETVFLRQNANISTGGVGVDVTENISQEIKGVAVRAAKAIGMVITGVDIIYEKSSAKSYVIELNDTPGIDIHHYPYMGSSRNVANDIVSSLLESNGETINRTFLTNRQS